MGGCLKCGQSNPEGFRFCGACGSPLVEAPRRPAGEERKVVTVLFCDLVGFTARSDRADPEDVGAMLRPFHARLRAEIERVGGTLDKLIGDAVMAVFRVPAVHEDDPERAVRCALRMLDAITELNQAHPALELAVRIGVNTGEALVALEPGADSEGVVGHMVNTAARLQGVAPVNGVVVGEATWRATQALFECQQLAPVQVKGKAEPVPIWRAHAARSRPGVDVTERPATPLIGRGEELAALRHCYAQAFGEHAVRLVTVLGEPLVGKSRLVRELAGFVDAQPELVAWRRGHCLSYGEAVGFWALGEIIKAQAGILESDDPLEVATKLDAAVGAVAGDASEREWLKARLAPLVGLATLTETPAGRDESFVAWRQFLHLVAGQSPLVLVIEDLHWADPALLDFLEPLLDQAGPADLLVVVTARPELLDRRPGWGAGHPMRGPCRWPPSTTSRPRRCSSPSSAGRACRRRRSRCCWSGPAATRCTPRSSPGCSRTGACRPGAATWPRRPTRRCRRSVQAVIAARLDTLAAEHKTLLRQPESTRPRPLWSRRSCGWSTVGAVAAGIWASTSPIWCASAWPLANAPLGRRWPRGPTTAWLATDMDSSPRVQRSPRPTGPWRRRRSATTRRPLLGRLRQPTGTGPGPARRRPVPPRDRPAGGPGPAPGRPQPVCDAQRRATAG